MIDLLKKTSYSLISSFLVSDLSDSLTIPHFLWEMWADCSWSLIFSEQPEQFAHIAHFCERPEQFTHIAHQKRGNERFVILDFLAKIFWANRSFAHFLWATWANRSRSLICLERPERFAHSRSFPLRDLSDSLTVAHLSWAIWVNCSQSLILFERKERMSNEKMSNERMSEFLALVFIWLNRLKLTVDKINYIFKLIFPLFSVKNCQKRSDQICWRTIFFWLIWIRPNYLDPVKTYGSDCMDPHPWFVLWTALLTWRVAAGSRRLSTSWDIVVYRPAPREKFTTKH